MKLTRSQVYNVAFDIAQEKINGLQFQIEDLSSGADIKSTSGDKHETSRAMMHLQQEQLTAQLSEARLMMGKLVSLRDLAAPVKIAEGSLIVTDGPIFYLTIALGKLVIDTATIYALSAGSPLGKEFIGKSKNDQITLNEKTYLIKDIR